MNPRIIKEIRLLFWPWCLVVAAAFLPCLSAALIHHFSELSTLLCGVGFFAGIPFLAAISLGGEFQQRTLSLLLGQPVGRRRVWAEKQAVLLVALAAAMLAYWFGWFDRNDLNGNTLTVVGAWLLATISSATFWTLTARSTVGGLVLGQVALFGLGVVAINVGLRVFGEEPSKTALHWAQAIGVALCVGYSGLMVWLGHRKLMGFQATGGLAGDDLLMVGPRLLPPALAELLRCRSTSPMPNLIRKELRLLRPLWLITLLFLACWTCVVITFRFIPRTEEWYPWREAVPGIVIGLYVCLAVILAGCLSLGEERASGTQSWHLTLPIPARLQWFIKLVIALGTGVVCSMMIPMLAVTAGQILLGSPFGSDWELGLPHPSREGIVPLLLALFVSFPAFWCASAANGTVRAALWVLPVMIALSLAGAGGFWIASEFKETADAAMTLIVSRWQVNPRHVTDVTSTIMRQDLWPLWLVFPTLLLAVFQSFRLFRAQSQDGLLPMVRRMAPLAFMAFVCALCFGLVVFAVERVQDSALVNEAYAAVLKLPINFKELDAAHPAKISVEELGKASPLSDSTRRWLRGSSITVAPGKAGKGKPVYFARVHFPDGSDFKMSFRPGE